MGRQLRSSWIRGVIDRTDDFWGDEFPDEDASTLPLFTGLAFLSRQIEEFHDRTLKPHGRVLTEYQTLAYLRTVGVASPTELNRILLQTPAGMTYTIDQLEKAKLVSRRPSASDRRSIQVTLTPAGKREAEKLMKAEVAAQRAVLAQLGAAKLQKTLAVVMNLIDSFEAREDPS
jgi:DNA-binding MarR family transcriptional regulator